MLCCLFQFSSLNLLHVCFKKITFIDIIINHNNSYENCILFIGARKILEIKSPSLTLFQILHMQCFSNAMLDYKQGVFVVWGMFVVWGDVSHTHTPLPFFFR